MNWDDPEEWPKAATRRPSNFVAPAPAEQPVRYEILPPAYELPMVTPAAMVQSSTVGTHEDRARGFQVATVPVALCFGVGVGVVALVGWHVPVFSVGMLATFWLAFLAWWLMAWGLHLLFSADGVAVLHTLEGWRYLRTEQRARLRRYERGGK